ncbi:hypothetical protein KUCAC02_034655, partial [Chaenocephalus aceratus]
QLTDHLTEDITLKFFQPGHTFMSADSFHHGVEQEMKSRPGGVVYDFDDFLSVVGNSNSKKVDGHLDALLRSLVLGKLGKAGHKPTLEEARRRFRDHVEGKQVLPADLRSPVYLTVLKHGDSATLETMMKVRLQ